MNLTKNLLVATLRCTALALSAAFAHTATNATDPDECLPPPGALNVLVLVLDDIGTDQLRMYANDPGPAYSCASAQVTTTPTPTLDVLRATGILFSRAYVNPLCSPTRGAILTGRYGLRTGVGSAIDRGTTAYTVPSTEQFLPELIRDGNTRNYARAAFGKWHLAEINARDEHPAENGFERFDGTKGNLDDHYTYRKISAVGGSASGLATATSVNLSPGVDPPSDTTWAASVTRRDAAAWINAQTRPFFAYVCFNPPHAPFQVPPTKLVSKKTRSKLAALGYETGERAAAVRADQSLVYQSQIEAVDREILELLAAIVFKLPNTMIVVIGDNGTPSETVIDPLLAGRVKRSVYELGTRVPMIVSGPLAWWNAGQTCRNLVGAVDLYRTLANFTGISNATIDAAVAATGKPNDSVSFYGSVLDPCGPGSRTFAYSELFGNVPPPIPPNVTWLRAMTDGSYRYVRRRIPNGTIFEELYDTTADPCSVTDLLLPPNVPTSAQLAAKAAMSAAMSAL